MKKTITGWTRWIPWGVTLLLAAWILSTFRTPRETSEFNIRAFSQLPVLLNGRIQPLDSVARNSLLLIRSKQSVALEGNKTMAATPWLLEVMAKPEQADQRKIFRIDNIELKGLLKLSEDDKHFSFNEIKNTWEELEKQARRIEKIEAQLRTPYEKGLAKLNFSIGLYFRLKNSLRPENSSDFIRELELFQAQIKPGLLALQQSQAKEEYNEEDLQKVVQFFRRYETLSKTGYPLVVPPSDSNHARDDWRTVGASLMESMRANKIQPAVQYYAALLAAYDKTTLPPSTKPSPPTNPGSSQTNSPPKSPKAHANHFLTLTNPSSRASPFTSSPSYSPVPPGLDSPHPSTAPPSTSLASPG